MVHVPKGHACGVPDIDRERLSASSIVHRPAVRFGSVVDATCNADGQRMRPRAKGPVAVAETCCARAAKGPSQARRLAKLEAPAGSA